MVQNFIHDKWGTIIELSNPDEFFNWPAEYWRTMIYERKLIVSNV